MRTTSLIIAVFLATASAAQAVTFSMTSPTAAGIGQRVTISVRLHLEEPINAVQGTLRYDPGLLSPQRFSDAGSVVSLWVRRPQVTETGIIAFAGIMPGGATGAGESDVTLFSFTAMTLAEGTMTLQLADLEAFLNEPGARHAPVKALGTTLRITAGEGTSAAPGEEADVTPPEPFALTLVSEPALYDGRWTVVFQAVDKDSGISSYQVRERFLGLSAPWRTISSPTALSDQSLLSIIEVRAFDGAANARIERIVPVRLRLLWAFIGLALAALAASSIRRGMRKSPSKGRAP